MVSTPGLPGQLDVMSEEPFEPISADDLAITWRTLRTVADNYSMGSTGEAALIEARRLVEVEMRAQHGDEAWEGLHV
jgi:hypothetical protein